MFLSIFSLDEIAIYLFVSIWILWSTIILRNIYKKCNRLESEINILNHDNRKDILISLICIDTKENLHQFINANNLLGISIYDPKNPYLRYDYFLQEENLVNMPFYFIITTMNKRQVCYISSKEEQIIMIVKYWNSHGTRSVQEYVHELGNARTY